MEELRQKEIPLGLTDFSDIVAKGCLYVDKTMYAHRIISSPRKFFFLSRPRRFGKTLFVSALEAIFQGRKELFEGLYIHDRWDWIPRPVIRLSMNAFSCHGYQQFRKNLLRYMTRVSQDLGILEDVSFDIETPEAYLDDMIRALYSRSGKKVVILIDEYDAPLSTGSAGTDDRKQIRNYLVDMYTALKTDEELISFVFMTGVIRYTNLSIFSRFNNLEDISDSGMFASICGYSEEEFLSAFKPYIDSHLKQNPDLDRKIFISQLRKYYDGYRFSPSNNEKVYNPVSLGTFFINGCEFRNYWWRTGSSSFVRDLVMRRTDCFNGTWPVRISQSDSAIFEIEGLDSDQAPAAQVHACLLQAGYLTIHDVEDDGMLLLDFPNEEVADSMLSFILSAKVRTDAVSPEAVSTIRRALLDEDLNSFVATFRAIYASIPHQSNRQANEGFFQAIMLNTLQILRIDARAEESVASGDSDLVVRIGNDLVYVFEFKCSGNAGKARRQLFEKEYHAKFALRRIHLVPMSFDAKKRNISDWQDIVL